MIKNTGRGEKNIDEEKKLHLKKSKNEEKTIFKGTV